MKKTKNSASRRDFLRKSLVVVPALTLGGMALGSMSNATAQAETSTPKAGTSAYTPTFFTKEEFAFLGAAVSRLIPSDDLGPGALEAGVPEFIDKQMETPYGVGANWYMQGPFHPEASPLFGYQLPLKPRELYKLGIADTNAFAKKQYGKVFSELPPAKQDEVLKLMESGEAKFSKVPSKTFFASLLQNTREGFFCDPVHGGNKGMVGWKLIGFPGARADFMDWVERNEKYPFPPVSINGERG